MVGTRARATRADARSELSELIDLCREKGVVRLMHAGTEIVLGPPVPPKAKDAKEGADPSLAARREYYATMLGRPVDDKELELLP